MISRISGKFLESSINLPSMEVILNNGLNKALLWKERFSRACLSTLSMASPIFHNGLAREMVEPYREKKGGWWPYLGECVVLFLHLWLVNEVMAHSTLLWLDLFSFQVIFFLLFLPHRLPLSRFSKRENKVEAFPPPPRTSSTEAIVLSTEAIDCSLQSQFTHFFYKNILYEMKVKFNQSN